MLISNFRLMALKEKLSQQRKHLDELDKHMYVLSYPDSLCLLFGKTCSADTGLDSDELTKDQGGEHN